MECLGHTGVEAPRSRARPVAPAAGPVSPGGYRPQTPVGTDIPGEVQYQVLERPAPKGEIILGDPGSRSSLTSPPDGPLVRSPRLVRQLTYRLAFGHLARSGQRRRRRRRPPSPAATYMRRRPG